ncbi:MAG: hypothetical protein ACR2JB_27525 [Bryobacteraceae bacterium]
MRVRSISIISVVVLVVAGVVGVAVDVLRIPLRRFDRLAVHA